MNARMQWLQDTQEQKLHFFENQPHGGEFRGKQRWSFVLAENNQFGRAGQLVTLDLTPADVHDPAVMSDYLSGYKPFGFRADEFSPVILVDKSTDKHRDFSSDDAFLEVDVKTGIEGKVPEVDPKTSLTPYTVVERAVGTFIPDRVSAQADYDVRKAGMKRCQRALMIDREKDVSTLLLTLANWDANNRVTLGAGFEWNGGASSDPILDLQTRMEESAQDVSDVVMEQRVANAFLRHQNVRDQMRQMLGDNAVADALTRVNMTQQMSRDFVVPGIPPIHVVSAKSRSTAGGTLNRIWGNDALLLTSPPGVPTDAEEIATSYTFRLKGPTGNGYVTREFRIEDRGSLGGIFIVCAMADIAVMAGSNCGGLIKAAYQ